ncbi:MAG: DMT family transporter [Pseudomonadota bacterium]
MSGPLPLSGILFLIFGLSLAALSGAQMKLLAGTLPVLFIIWARFAGYFVIMVPVALVMRKSRLWPPANPGLQVLRAGCLCGGTLCFLMGARTLPFADAIAILYAYPFLLTVAARLVLGERVRPVVWGGVATGFIGVLIVMRPGFDGIGTDALWVFGAALSVTGLLVVNRMLGPVANPMITSLYGAGLATLLTAPALLAGLPHVEIWSYAILASLAVTAAVSQTAIIVAFARAPASDLAVFTYAEIVAAVAIGWAMFGTWPDASAWAGIVLIAASGVFVARAIRGPIVPRRAPRI